MRYTYVKQHDVTDCAAACLAMVCLHYKKETTITRLRDMMGTDLKGTNIDEILPYKQENVLKLVVIVFLGIDISQVVVSFVRQWMITPPNG